MILNVGYCPNIVLQCLQSPCSFCQALTSSKETLGAQVGGCEIIDDNSDLFLSNPACLSKWEMAEYCESGRTARSSINKAICGRTNSRSAASSCEYSLCVVIPVATPSPLQSDHSLEMLAHAYLCSWRRHDDHTSS